MATDTNLSELIINSMSYQQAIDNADLLQDHEFVLTTDKNVPVPTFASDGKYLGVVNGEFVFVFPNDVKMMTTSDMLTALTTGTYNNGVDIEIGQIVTPVDDDGYFIGHIYQFRTLPDTTFTWADITNTVEITNSNMSLGLTNKLYVNGQVFICSDSGNYLQGHMYKYNVTNDTPAVLSWIDITPTAPATMAEYFTNAQKSTFLTTASQSSVGKTIISYEDGNIYQLKSTETPAGSGNYVYSWEQKTMSLPMNGTHYVSGDTNITIDDGGVWIIFGNVTNLNVTTTTGVVISILGNLTNMTLPSTQETVLINSVGYNGMPITSRPAALALGSMINGFHFGITDLT